jgi:hypothetical protein
MKEIIKVQCPQCKTLFEEEIVFSNAECDILDPPKTDWFQYVTDDILDVVLQSVDKQRASIADEINRRRQLKNDQTASNPS